MTDVRKGLENFGNTCYINSIVQCMNNLPGLTESISSSEIAEWWKTKEGILMHTFSLFFTSLNTNNRLQLGKNDSQSQSLKDSNVLLFNFVKLFGENQKDRFESGQQQDAHDFLIYILEQLQILENDYVQSFCSLSLINLVNCRKNHLRQEIARDNILSLPIPNGKTTLKECIKTYFDPKDEIDPNNLIFCSQCNLNIESRSWSKIQSIGNILIIHLLRFEVINGRIYKTNSPIEIPEILNLNSFSINQNQKLDYKLNSICFHEGVSITSGHYISLCRDKNGWVFCNDENIYKESNFDITRKDLWKNFANINRTPYLLFYSKMESLFDNFSFSKMVFSLSKQSIHDSDDDQQTFRKIVRDVTMHTIQSDLDINTSNNTSVDQSNPINMSFPTNISIPKKKKDLKKMIKRLTMQKLRANEAFRSLERIKDAKAKTLSRMDTGNRAKEKEKDAEFKRKNRKDENKRAEEQAKNTAARRISRTDSDRKDDEQAKNTAARRISRTDSDRRAEEQAKDTAARRIIRSDSDKRSQEQKQNTLDHFNKRNNIINIIETFEKNIQEGPTYICVTCGGLFFRRSVNIYDPLKPQNLPLNKLFWVKIKCNDQYWICLTCKRYDKNNKIPPLALCQRLDFPVVDQRLKNLSNLEERLCAPRIPFARIRPLGWDQQQGLVGNVVNVPLKADDVTNLLPREFKDTETIQLKFMRKKNYNNAYIDEKIRPAAVIEALEYLVELDLFKNAGITLSNKWVLNNKKYSKINFVVDPDDAVGELNDNSNSLSDSDSNSDDGDDFAGNQDNQDPTLIQSDFITAAPAEKNQPKSIVFENDAEALTFIKIYGGKAPKYPATMSYGSVCKSEFRRYDRRCAEDITKIFFSYKKLVALKLLASIQMSLRKTGACSKLTAQQVLNDKALIDGLMATGQMNQFLRTIRSSPQYWELKKIEMNSMIRQLGCPTFFITFSPAEVNWSDLIKILAKVSNNQDLTDKDIENMTKADKAHFIKKDPVTTARYFENRMLEMLKFIFSKVGPFRNNEVTDYFWRVDFQYRGSPHVHMLTWNKNAPFYEKNDDKTKYESNLKKCVDFVDKYITCQRPINNKICCSYEPDKYNVSVSYQEHRHFKRNCKKLDRQDNLLCKYNFPRPLLDSTIILQPLDKNDHRIEQAYRDYINIRNQLIIVHENYIKNNTEVSLKQFLANTGFSFDQYILALRSSIDKTVVFLKRHCSELMVNQYNKDIIVRHRGNMDIQFITDPYGCASYVSAYLLKSNAVMSKLLKKASEDVSKGNLANKQKLNIIASKFHNCSEISAQEAVYTILSMPVSKASRESVFINTYPNEKRTQVVKLNKYLELLPKDSTDIFRTGLLDHYKNRPDKMKMTCLAEFAAWFDYVSNNDFINRNHLQDKISRFPEDDDELDDDLYDDVLDDTEQPPNKEYIALKNKDGYIKERTKAKIIRYKTYNKHKELYDYYRVQLMMFVPWVDDMKDLEVNDTFKKFEACKDIIALNRSKYSSIVAEEYEAAQEQVEKEIEEQHAQLEDAVDDLNVANNALLDDIFDSPDREEAEEEYGFHAFLKPADLNTKTIGKTNKIIVPKKMDDTDYENLMLKLNKGQHFYMMNFIRLLKTKQIFNHFISGSGGTGKSQLIKAIYQTAIRYFNPKDDPNYISVVIGAYTGMAAFGVRGMTLHSLFHFRSQSNKIMGELTGASLELAVKEFENVQLLIIDEISMVGTTMFESINKRLIQIKKASEDHHFGGISVIVLGDFNQLQPIGDNFVYKLPRNNPFNNLVNNHLWTDFKLHVLTQIMRLGEGEIELANALNQLGTHGVIGLSENQVKMFNSRIITDLKDKPDDAIALFHTNKKVSEYNEFKVQQSKEKGFINDAVDIARGSIKDKQAAKAIIKKIKDDDDRDRSELPNSVHIKCGIKYMFTTNQYMEDGICNGTIGIIKGIILTQNVTDEKTAVKRVWMEFLNPDVGVLTRNSSDGKYLAQKDGIKNPLLVPILPISTMLKIEYTRYNFNVERIQFGFREAEGITIHKSQGATMKRVFVSIQGHTLTRALLYVALSRITSLAGLYLHGSDSIESKKLRAIGKNERSEQVKRNLSENESHNEMLRMKQNCLIDNAFNLLNYNGAKNPQSLSIMFHNTRGFFKHQQKFMSDWGYQNADMLLMVETHLKAENANKVSLKGYTLINLSCGSGYASAHGQICFIRNEKLKNVTFIKNNTRDGLGIYGKNENTELSILKYTRDPFNQNNQNTFYICYIYKHPQEDNRLFFQKFEKFIGDIFTNIKPLTEAKLFVVGDFNIDFNKDTDAKNQMKKYGLIRFKHTLATFDKGSTIDWCFTNKSATGVCETSENVELYESWFSDHRPIWLQIENIKSSIFYNPNMPTSTDDYEFKSADDNANVPTNQFVQIDGITIDINDLKKLENTNWLNDNIINIYLKLLVMEEKNSFAFDTFVFKKIKNGQVTDLARWFVRDYKKIINSNKLIIPIHNNSSHWSIIAINQKESFISHMDSLYKSNKTIVSDITNMLETIFKEFSGISRWPLTELPNKPKQKNDYDCGVFCCLFARHFLDIKTPGFEQSKIPKWRKHIQHEIISKQIIYHNRK